MENKSLLKIFIGIVCVLMTPAICSANAGIPVIFVSYPLMLLALVVVIPLEAIFIKKYLDKTDKGTYHFKKILWVSFLANLATTVIGFPLAWLFLLLVEFLAVGIMMLLPFPPFYPYLNLLGWAWLGPAEGAMAHIMIGIAIAINLVVAFFISILVERAIVYRKLKKIDIIKIKKAVLNANIFSYIFLVLAGAIYICYSYVSGGTRF